MPSSALRPATGLVWPSFPFTAARQSRIYTGFPLAVTTTYRGNTADEAQHIAVGAFRQVSCPGGALGLGERGLAGAGQLDEGIQLRQILLGGPHGCLQGAVQTAATQRSRT